MCHGSLVPYRQVQNVSLLRHSVARLVGHLSGTWAKTVAYDVFPSVRARILTEALFMGGCFGGVMALWARARASRRLYTTTLLHYYTTTLLHYYTTILKHATRPSKLIA